MTERLWLLADDDEPSLNGLRERLWAHGARRVDAQALLIEDGIEAAVERMIADDCELTDARAWFRAKLLAAVGEQP